MAIVQYPTIYTRSVTLEGKRYPVEIEKQQIGDNEYHLVITFQYLKIRGVEYSNVTTFFPIEASTGIDDGVAKFEQTWNDGV